MKPELKIITIGAVLCVVGAILMDCHIGTTGAICLTLGALAIAVGPLAMSLED